MRLTVVGTLPYERFPLTVGECVVRDGRLHIGEHTVSVIRGTSALLCAACIASDFLGLEPPTVIIAGDIGRGNGSRLVYAHMEKHFPNRDEQAIVFHYLQPDLDWHNRILIQAESAPKRPLLIADAGYMYVAKMSGFAASYDLFTPDAGEMAFLADESAPHPFYTRGFLLQEHNNVSDLITRAYLHENAPHYLLVKGAKDTIACKEGIICEVSEPSTETMEPIGGTGDTLTGIVSSLVANKISIEKAAINGAIINRYLGRLANPTPASAVADLLSNLPNALKTILM